MLTPIRSVGNPLDQAGRYVGSRAEPTIVAGCLLAYALLRKQPSPAHGEERNSGNPLRLGAAVQMALAFQLVLLAVPAAERLWGPGGVLGSAAVLGLTDMDALTYSMSRLGAETGDAALAARAIAIGLVSNTVLKLALALGLGAPGFRRSAAGGLLALAVSLLPGLLIWR